MFAQGYIGRAVYDESLNQPLPTAKEIQTPQQPLVDGVDVGYFTSWVQQQVIERYGAPRVYNGGLRIKTTLDLGHAARCRTSSQRLPPRPRRPHGGARRDRKLDR